MRTLMIVAPPVSSFLRGKTQPYDALVKQRAGYAPPRTKAHRHHATAATCIQCATNSQLAQARDLGKAANSLRYVRLVTDPENGMNDLLCQT